jgi:carbamate kinase
VDLVGEGWGVVVVHGNGPQVGDSLARGDLASHEVEPLPLGVLVAETAGWIGYMVQQSLQNALERAGIRRDVVTLITQTEVSSSDPLLGQATKPIGHVLSPARAAELRARGVPVGADRQGRPRRLAASPMPVAVVEHGTVRRLVEGGAVVIAAGGGGPPVYRHPALGWEGLDAVVDKDRTAAVLGCELDAELLLILTDVPAVIRGFGTPAARPIARLTVRQAARLAASGQLGSGNMLPKVEAAIGFVRGRRARAVIAELGAGAAAMRGEAGTTIVDEDR